MSKLNELIQELCPNGVEYVELGSIANLSNTGVDKKINPNEDEILLLNYMDIFKNNYIDNSIPNMKVTANKYKIETCDVKKGDIFITPSSEKIDEIGIASVIVDDIENCCYSYHIMRIRLNKSNFTTSCYIRYCFESDDVRKQILKKATGLTRYGLTKGKFENLQIPLPPLAVQEEIVRILDNFTELTAGLTAGLTAELTARKKQYEYYRDHLLDFGDDVEWKPLGEVGKICMCKRIFKDQTQSIGDIPFYKIGTFGKKADGYISRDLFEEYKSKFSYPKKGDILISASGTIGRTVIFDGEDSYFQDSNIVWIDNDESRILNKYLFYFYKIIKWAVSEGGTISRLYNDNIMKTKIRFPKSLKEQQRIVDILDRFDTLCTDISEGLPAEIKARQQQYEYYRDKLLTFSKKES